MFVYFISFRENAKSKRTLKIYEAAYNREKRLWKTVENRPSLRLWLLKVVIR